MGWIQKLFLGVDLDEEQQRSDELDAAIARENQKDYAAPQRDGGFIGPMQPNIYEQIQERRGTAAADATYAGVLERESQSRIDVRDEVGDAFYEGLQEGYENTTGGIRSALAAPFNFAWKALPWQLIVAAAVFAFFYFGGGPWLKRALGKVFK